MSFFPEVSVRNWYQINTDTTTACSDETSN